MTGAGKITQFAPAKINLYLHVTGRRDDGYHLLDSLMAFAGIGDVISVMPAKTLSLIITGPFADGLDTGPENLVLKAAVALQSFCGVTQGAAIELQKNLPIASGIGGGSADAAATLKALCKLWGVSPDQADLLDLALELGADVPICLSGAASFVSGIGENLTPGMALPEVPMVLVNPGVAVSTPAVFKARKGGYSLADTFTDLITSPAHFVEILSGRNNDLMEPAIELVPEISDILSLISSCEGNLFSRMSGSGATCFGLFSDIEAGQKAAQLIKKTKPHWWVQETKLISRY